MKKFIKVLSKPCFIILFLFSLGCDQASEKKSENDNLQNSFDGINRIYEGKLDFSEAQALADQLSESNFV